MTTDERFDKIDSKLEDLIVEMQSRTKSLMESMISFREEMMRRFDSIDAKLDAIIRIYDSNSH